MGVQLESKGCWPVGWGTSFVKALRNNRITNLFRNREPHENPIDKLSLEIYWIILKHCDEKSLLKMRQVSKTWLETIQNPTFFKVSYKSPIHPISWAFMTQSYLKIEDANRVSLKYYSKGPGEIDHRSVLVFIKTEGLIELEDSEAVLKGKKLQEGYDLSPWWIFQEVFNNENFWISPDLKDEKGQYFMKLVKGKQCLLRHTLTGKLSPERFFIQSIK